MKWNTDVKKREMIFLVGYNDLKLNQLLGIIFLNVIYILWGAFLWPVLRLASKHAHLTSKQAIKYMICVLASALRI